MLLHLKLLVLSRLSSSTFTPDQEVPWEISELKSTFKYCPESSLFSSSTTFSAPLTCLTRSSILMHADCVFADFDGARAAGVFSGGTANFVRCSFENNTLVDAEKGDAAVIFADGLDEPDYEGYDDDGDALVRVEGCTFSGNEPSSAPIFLADDTGAGLVPYSC